MCALLDRTLVKRLSEIIDERGLTTVVETGIDKGGSTRLFAEMASKVVGIDNMQERVDALKSILVEEKLFNVSLMCRNSPDGIKELLDDGLDASRTLFFLDAHWQKYWPLKDEIRSIPRGQGVLVMHDARVPGCPNLGVDQYEGQELSYEYLKDVLTDWSPDHTVEYNDDTAEFPKRGVMVVYPR